MFYIYAIGFVIALGFEQFLKVRPLSVDKTMQNLPVRSATILFGLIVVAVTYSPIVAYR